jgi:hypothetical protein
MTDEERGRCRECGADLVDWETVHGREIADIETLVTELSKELVRHHYWHVEIPQQVRDRAQRYKPEVLADRTRRAIHTRVGAPANQLGRDGMQTPDVLSPDRQIYFMGMHAVAACCRKCMQYWHGIPADRRLTAVEEQYFAQVVWTYVCRRMAWPEREELIADDSHD